MLLYADLTYKLRSAIFNVYNALGFGHKENVYERALEQELKEIKLPFSKEETLDVRYKGIKVGIYRPDFIIDGKIIVELKALEFVPKSSEIQMLHYLKTTGFKLGFLVNFGYPKLTIKRIIWTEK